MSYKMLDLKNRIHGPVFSIITPFNAQGEIDYACLENYLSYLHSGGARIFYVMAYNSRYSELSFEEIKSLNYVVTHKVKSIDSKNIVIVGDPIHCSTKVSIEFAMHAEEIGADLISLIFGEKYYFEEQVYSHFKMVADSTGIGILIHEMPLISGLGGHVVDWPLTLLDRLANIENIIAIKEDAKKNELTLQIVKLLNDRVAIITSGGGKRQWLDFVGLGCQAWLNGIGVFEPRLATMFYQYYLNKQKDLYMKIINDIEVPFFEQTVKLYGWHLAIKSALEVYGLMDRHERMPMMALPDEKHREIEKLVNSLPIKEILQ